MRFIVDGRVPHEDLPAAQALAVFEWGLNLVIALRSHRFLMLHAAVLERGGRALRCRRRQEAARRRCAPDWPSEAGGCCPTSSGC